MKNLPWILSTLVFIFFISCGSETVTNHDPVPGEEVIFSMDSFAINLTNALAVKDTNIILTNAPNIKITFKCSTNADSVNSFALLRLVSGDSTHLFMDSTIDEISFLNRDFTIILSGSSTYSLSVAIQANRNSNVSCFIRLRDFKISKLN